MILEIHLVERGGGDRRPVQRAPARLRRRLGIVAGGHVEAAGLRVERRGTAGGRPRRRLAHGERTDALRSARRPHSRHEACQSA